MANVLGARQVVCFNLEVVGKILRYQEFYDEAQALEAAGLSE